LKANATNAAVIKHMMFDVPPTIIDLTSPNDEFYFILKAADGSVIDWDTGTAITS